MVFLIRDLCYVYVMYKRTESFATASHDLVTALEGPTCILYSKHSLVFLKTGSFVEISPNEKVHVNYVLFCQYNGVWNTLNLTKYTTYLI